MQPTHTSTRLAEVLKAGLAFHARVPQAKKNESLMRLMRKRRELAEQQMRKEGLKDEVDPVYEENVRTDRDWRMRLLRLEQIMQSDVQVEQRMVTVVQSTRNYLPAPNNGIGEALVLWVGVCRILEEFGLQDEVPGFYLTVQKALAILELTSEVDGFASNSRESACTTGAVPIGMPAPKQRDTLDWSISATAASGWEALKEEVAKNVKAMKDLVSGLTGLLSRAKNSDQGAMVDNAMQFGSALKLILGTVVKALPIFMHLFASYQSEALAKAPGIMKDMAWAKSLNNVQNTLQWVFELWKPATWQTPPEPLDPNAAPSELAQLASGASLSFFGGQPQGKGYCRGLFEIGGSDPFDSPSGGCVRYDLVELPRQRKMWEWAKLVAGPDPMTRAIVQFSGLVFIIINEIFKHSIVMLKDFAKRNDKCLRELTMVIFRKYAAAKENMWKQDKLELLDDVKAAALAKKMEGLKLKPVAGALSANWTEYGKSSYKQTEKLCRQLTNQWKKANRRLDDQLKSSLVNAAWRSQYAAAAADGGTPLLRLVSYQYVNAISNLVQSLPVANTYYTLAGRAVNVVTYMIWRVMAVAALNELQAEIDNATLIKEYLQAGVVVEWNLQKDWEREPNRTSNDETQGKHTGEWSLVDANIDLNDVKCTKCALLGVDPKQNVHIFDEDDKEE